MKKSSKKRISSFLCAAMMVATAVAVSPMSASAADTGNLERDRLVGSHFGHSSTSVPVSFGTETSVDYVTGNLYSQLLTSIHKMELNYNSQDTYGSELGYGFISRFQQRVNIYNQPGSHVPLEDDIMIYKNDDGKRDFLERHETATGEWYWGSDYGSGLRFARDGFSYGNDSTHQEFGKAGELTVFTLQRLDYAETFRVTNIAGGGYSASKVEGYIFGQNSRTLDFIYGADDSPTEKPRIMSVQDTSHIGGVDSVTNMRLLHDPLKRLVEVEGNYGTASEGSYRFRYDGESSRIASAWDARSGKTMEVTYTLLDGLYKVTFIKVTDASGTVVDQKQFAYGNGQTVVINQDGSMTIKTY